MDLTPNPPPDPNLTSPPTITPPPTLRLPKATTNIKHILHNPTPYPTLTEGHYKKRRAEWAKAASPSASLLDDGATPSTARKATGGTNKALLG